MITFRRLITASLLFVFLLSGCQLIGGGQEGGDSEVGGGVGTPTSPEGQEGGEGSDGGAAVTPEGENGEQEPAEGAGGGDGEETSPPSVALPRITLPAAERLTPAPVSPYTPGSTVQHVVQQGEWLHQIARCYGASYTAVFNLNPLFNPNIIQPNRTIIVPNVGSDGAISGPPCVQPYMVQGGDSFPALAQRFGTDAALLQRANPGALVAGRTIYVPDNSGTAVNITPPTLSQSLLFNLDGDLAFWEAGGDLQFVIDSERYLLDLVTNAEGNWVLTRQTRGSGMIDVVLLDRGANSGVVLESDVATDISFPGRESMLISPDGQNGAYLVRNGSSFDLTTFSTSDPDGKVTAGIGHDVDENFIPQLFEGPDNGRFYLLDPTGIYEYSYGLGGEPRQLITIDPENFDAPLNYNALSWSPTGRYLLLLGQFFEGQGHFVLDSETGNVVAVPEVTIYVFRNDSGWLPDGRLQTARLVFPDEESRLAETAVYQPQTDGDGNLSLNELSVTSLALPEGLGVVGEAFGFTADLPDVLPNNEQLVLLFHGGQPNGAGLFQAPNASAPVSRVASFNGSMGQTVWSSSGRSVLVNTFPSDGNGAGDLLYVSLDSSETFSLINWLGFQIADFHWIGGN